MFKYFVVLAVAVAAASATTKEEVMSKLTKLVGEVDFYSVAGRMVLSRTVDALKAYYPSSADCVDEITKEPLEKFDEYFTKAIEQMKETASALVEELVATDDSDQEALAAISEKMDPFGSTYDLNTAFHYAYKNSFDDKFHAYAKEKCNCEKYGWCSVLVL